MIVAPDIAVLAESPVYPGLAALINSLVRHGFNGNIWVGFRGVAPEWASLAARPGTCLRIGACDVHLVRLNTARPFTYHKPTFVRQVFEDLNPTCDAVVYMDTDIVINRDWSFFKAWMGYGMAIVEDIPQHPVGRDHPKRLALIEWLESLGFTAARDLDRYFNAGFVGLPRSLSGFLNTWTTLVDTAETALSLRQMAGHLIAPTNTSPEASPVPARVEGVLKTIFHHDQDAFNMALMATAVPFSAYGPDGMGFSGSWNVPMVHAVGAVKPWNKRFMYHRIRYGAGPSATDVIWWRYSDYPLRAVGRGQRARAMADLYTARALG